MSKIKKTPKKWLKKAVALSAVFVIVLTACVIPCSAKLNSGYDCSPIGYFGTNNTIPAKITNIFHQIDLIDRTDLYDFVSNYSVPYNTAISDNASYDNLLLGRGVFSEYTTVNGAYFETSLSQKIIDGNVIFDSSKKMKKWSYQEKVGLIANSSSVNARWQDALCVKMTDVYCIPSKPETFSHRARFELFSSGEYGTCSISWECTADLYGLKSNGNSYSLEYIESYQNSVSKIGNTIKGFIQTLWYLRNDKIKNDISQYELVVFKNVELNGFVEYSGDVSVLIGAPDDTWVYKLDVEIPYRNTKGQLITSDIDSINLPVGDVNIDFEDVSVVDWVITQVNAVLSLEIMPHVTLGGILWVVIGLSLVFVIMKLFLGG